MNKKELIEKYEYLNHDCFRRVDTSEILKDLKQLDEPQKVVVPQFVAEYIEESRLKGWDLLASMCFVLNTKNKKTTKWIYLGENKNIFALAWIFGYEVEKEPKYIVKIKGLNEDNRYLNYDSIDDEWYFTDAENGPAVGTHHTRQQLEKFNFGWVFDCEGVEVEEVEE